MIHNSSFYFEIVASKNNNWELALHATKKKHETFFISFSTAGISPVNMATSEGEGRGKGGVGLHIINWEYPKLSVEFWLCPNKDMQTPSPQF